MCILKIVPGSTKCSDFLTLIFLLVFFAWIQKAFLYKDISLKKIFKYVLRAKARRIGPAGKKFLLDAQLKSISLIHTALLGGVVTRFYTFSRNLEEEERKFSYKSVFYSRNLGVSILYWKLGCMSKPSIFMYVSIFVTWRQGEITLFVFLRRK